MSGAFPAAYAAPPVTPGDCVGRYELLYPAAQGGMGAVWAARLRGMSGFERLFAIKMVLPEYAADPSFRAMFLDEARIASRIAHPNVAPVIDIGEHQGGLYLVMEWIDGDSIHLLNQAARKAGGRIAIPVVLRVLADACAGLHAAHELRDKSGALLEVVHRDISPQNILVTIDGATKLIDFGVAKAKGRLHAETSVGSLKGKLRFMAPEQASGVHVDRRADIFSMGAVLFFLLTGEYAFDGPNDAATLHALLGGQARRPLPSDVEPVIASIVDRAMQRDPNLRFPTAGLMQEAIEDAIRSLGLKATTSAVQAFYAVTMRERVGGRVRLFETASRAVEERARVREFLEQRASADATGSASAVSRSIVAPPAGTVDPLAATGDRPTSPEPFVVRAIEFESTYQRVAATARRRTRAIVVGAVSTLLGGIVVTGLAVAKRSASAPRERPPLVSAAPRVLAPSDVTQSLAPVAAASVIPAASSAPTADPPPASTHTGRRAAPEVQRRPHPRPPVVAEPAPRPVDPVVSATESRK